MSTTSALLEKLRKKKEESRAALQSANGSNNNSQVRAPVNGTECGASAASPTSTTKPTTSTSTANTKNSNTLINAPPSFASSPQSELKYRDTLRDPLAATLTSGTAVRVLEKLLSRHVSSMDGGSHGLKRSREEGDEEEEKTEERAAPLSAEESVERTAEYMVKVGFRRGEAAQRIGDSLAAPSIYSCTEYWDACQRAHLDVVGSPRDRCADVNTYQRKDRLSHGVYGVVFSAYKVAPPPPPAAAAGDSAVDAVSSKKTLFALKHIKKEWLEQSQVGFPPYLLREFDLLSRLQHPNIVASKELVLLDPTPLPGTGDANNNRNSVSNNHQEKNSLREHKDVFLVMEHCTQDLKAYMTRYAAPQRPYLHVSTAHLHCPSVHENFLSRVKCIALQMLNAISFMHSHRILHRDLKTSNVLVGDGGMVRLCDFGLGRHYREGESLSPTVVTLMYRAPELHLGVTDYSHHMDVWSFGCILAELFIKKPLFPANDDPQHLVAVCDVLGIPTEDNFPGVYKMDKAKSVLRAMGRWNRENKLRSVFESSSCADARLLPPSGLDLLQKIFSWCPSHRPSAEEAMAHPFFHEAPFPCTPAELTKPMPTVPAGENSSSSPDVTRSSTVVDVPPLAPRGSTTSVPPPLQRVAVGPADRTAVIEESTVASPKCVVSGANSMSASPLNNSDAQQAHRARMHMADDSGSGSGGGGGFEDRSPSDSRDSATAVERAAQQVQLMANQDLDE